MMRIEEAAERLDDRHQPLDVRVRRIALVRRRLDAVDRQRREHRRGAAERLAIGREHGAAVRRRCAVASVRSAVVVDRGRLRRGKADGLR